MSYRFSRPVKLVVANNSEYTREGFKNVLTRYGNERFEIVTEAPNGQQLLHAIESLKPDIVITDIGNNDPGKLAFIRSIIEYNSAIGVIVLFSQQSLLLISELYQAGARGFLLNNTCEQELVEAISKVSSGEIFYSNSTAKNICNEVVSFGKRFPFERKFSEKEKLIMRMICEELTTKEIAARLSISIRTVEDHSKRIKEKIGCKNLVGIALWAERNKLLVDG